MMLFPTTVLVRFVMMASILYCSLCRAEYILSIELNKFNNPNGLLIDGVSKCPVSTCLTYFKFCLVYTESAESGGKREECLSKFETDIIGANMIGEEQFQLTTNSIKFRLNSTWNRFEENNGDGGDAGAQDYADHEQLVLLIQVLNYERSQPTQKTTSPRLISEWKLPIRFFKLNKWIRYENSVNYKLRQVFLFDYRLECADDYYGPKCEIPVCSTGCDLSRGGYCQKPNECICKSGYFGANCDLLIEDPQIVPSSSSSSSILKPKLPLTCEQPCLNGGRCVMGKCRCDTRLYDGPQCQIRIVQPCSSSTACLNGASCLPTGECLCAPGYVGARCQIKRLNSQCGTVTCYNGGTCFINNENEYACICHPLFDGKLCENKRQQATISSSASSSVSTSSPVILAHPRLPAAISPNRPPPSIHQLVDSNYYFTSEEMVMITLVGIGMPIFLILLTCFLCRLTIRKQYDQYSVDFSLPISSSTSGSSGSSSASSSASSSPPSALKSKIISVYQQQKQQQQQLSNQICQEARVCKQNIYVSNMSGQLRAVDEVQQDPNTIYASLYEDFVPSSVKNYVLETNYCVMSSIV